MSSDKTKKILIINLLVFFVLILVSVFVYIYIDQKTEKFLVFHKEVSEASESDVTSLRLKYNQLEPKISKINSYVIDSKNIVSFLNKLDSFASKSGVKLDIQSVDLKEVTRKVAGKDERIHGELILSLRTLGSWQETISFITFIEKVDKKVLIEDVRLGAVFNEGGNSWSAIINLRGITN